LATSNRGFRQSKTTSKLARLPKALKEEHLPNGTTLQRYLYTPHSLRATAATALLPYA
jgi:hypothetical protein